MVIEFDVKKIKKRVEKLSPEHFYPNPLDYTLCIFTAMGIYFSLFNSTYSDENQSILIFKLI